MKFFCTHHLYFSIRKHYCICFSLYFLLFCVTFCKSRSFLLVKCTCEMIFLISDIFRLLKFLRNILIFWRCCRFELEWGKRKREEAEKREKVKKPWMKILKSGSFSKIKMYTKFSICVLLEITNFKSPIKILIFYWDGNIFLSEIALQNTSYNKLWEFPSKMSHLLFQSLFPGFLLPSPMTSFHALAPFFF